jgi:hypothetical protein
MEASSINVPNIRIALLESDPLRGWFSLDPGSYPRGSGNRDAGI